MPKINRALVSVTDKTGIVDFCKVLSNFHVEILSTGGTAKVLRNAGIKVVDVAEYTGSPEVLDGRLKTLHPKIEGGILGIRDNPSHQKDMKDLGILPIDMVIVNLYAFEKTVSKEGCSLEDAIENIDIGGPTMLRAAAKNYQDVTVVADAGDYARLSEELKRNGGEISRKTNFELAVKVFQTTAQYDSAISFYLLTSPQFELQTGLASTTGPHGKSSRTVVQTTALLVTPKLEKEGDSIFPSKATLQFEKLQDLRYGENPHQRAVAYRDILVPDGVVVQTRQLHGKELSFNNFIDLEGALNCVQEFSDMACVIIKHTNPCGVALGKTLKEAFLRAKESDPVSCFGGIVGLNRKVDEETALAIKETFFECIIAPGYDEAALKILTAKKNLRLLVLDPFKRSAGGVDYKRIGGGLLIQERDCGTKDLKTCDVPTKLKPTDDEYGELDFAWKVCKHVKSNAIVFTKNRQVLGVGAGQMSRVDSVKIAVMKSQQSLKGSVMASDAFFPFRDAVDAAANEGITAIVQPGGSVKDDEAIQAANEHGMSMIFTGMRHFRH